MPAPKFDSRLRWQSSECNVECFVIDRRRHSCSSAIYMPDLLLFIIIGWCIASRMDGRRFSLRKFHADRERNARARATIDNHDPTISSSSIHVVADFVASITKMTIISMWFIFESFLRFFFRLPMYHRSPAHCQLDAARNNSIDDVKKRSWATHKFIGRSA